MAVVTLDVNAMRLGFAALGTLCIVSVLISIVAIYFIWSKYSTIRKYHELKAHMTDTYEQQQEQYEQSVVNSGVCSKKTHNIITETIVSVIQHLIKNKN